MIYNITILFFPPPNNLCYMCYYYGAYKNKNWNITKNLPPYICN